VAPAVLVDAPDVALVGAVLVLGQRFDGAHHPPVLLGQHDRRHCRDLGFGRGDAGQRVAHVVVHAAEDTRGGCLDSFSTPFRPGPDMLALSDPSDTAMNIGMNTNVTVRVGAAIFAALIPVLRAQATDAAARLARAQLIEEQEGDLRTADREYRALLDSKDADAVHGETALRLGRMLWRLGRQDEGRPFLERAVAAGGEIATAATAVLQGQGPEGKQAQEIAEKVKDAIARNAMDDLKWLGTAAMPSIVRELGDRRAAALKAWDAFDQAANDQLPRPAVTDFFAVGYSAGPQSTRSLQPGAVVFFQLLRMVWTIGGEEAQKFLRSAIADDDVRWRCLVASAGRGLGEPGWRLPLFAALLLDKDPTGWVPRAVLDVVPYLETAQLVDPLTNGIPVVRAAIWDRVNGAVAGFASLEQPLRHALADPDPAVVRSASGFLAKASQTELGMRLFLEWLPSAPTFVPPSNWAQVPFEVALRAAKALGPVNPADGKDPRRHLVADEMVTICSKGPRPDPDQLLDVLALGYDSLSANLVSYAVSAATPAERLRAVQRMNLSPEHRSYAYCLRSVDLPPEALPGLQKVTTGLLEKLALRPDESDRLTGERGDLVAEVSWLFEAVARTGNPAAPAFLLESVRRQPQWTWRLFQPALILEKNIKTAEVLPLLRELMVAKVVTPENGDQHWAPRARNQLFAALSRRGDVEAIPLFAQAIQAGLEPNQPTADNRDTRFGVDWFARGWTAYDEANLLKAWQTLLGSEPRSRVFADAAVRVVPESPRSVQRLLLAAILEPRDRPEAGVAPRQNVPPGAAEPMDYRPSLILQVVRELSVEPEDRDFKAFEALLGHPDFCSACLEGLQPAAIHRLAGAIRPMLSGKATSFAMEALQRGQEFRPVEDMLSVLRNHENRLGALNFVAVGAAPEVVHEVETMARDADPGVRAGACAALGRILSTGSAATLIEELRDKEEQVVSAATEALKRIRQYHEQKAYWDQFAQGITTGRDAATSKLLIQSKPGAPKEQRLLALRSLAALGAPEALPYLIEWAHDADAEVAQAAKDAITKIHQQAGVK
jgi:hypothetical protein